MIRKFIEEVNKITKNRMNIGTLNSELYVIDKYEVYLPIVISRRDIIDILNKINWNYVQIYKVNIDPIYYTLDINFKFDNIVPCTRGVSALIMNKNKEILIEDHIKTDALTLPGGKLDFRDSDKYESLKRELYEELGIIISDAYFNYIKLNYIEYPANSNSYSVHEDCNFIITIDDIEGEIYNKEPEKHRFVKWMSIEELSNPNLKLSVILQEVISRIK